MADVLVREGANHVVDTVNGLDVGKESVSKTLTLVSTTNKSGNIHYREHSRDPEVWGKLYQ